ncbi:MAG: alpha/beta hydrolase [Lachnospiraceae bacterium]|nr:alpha/beta hydrolase [Lachnospiraceae bacterium]MDY4970722.1 alpha/beta hydrolase [Lachnospiraceae bacterium]
MKKICLNLEREKAYPCIEDEMYCKQMKTIVEPYLVSVGKNGRYEREPGKYLYYESYMAEDAAGTVIIAHGFTESAEKYKEVIFYFLKEHYNVFILDHRGHGRSIRELQKRDFSLTHINDFNDYVEDFRGFIEEIAVSQAGTQLPFYIFAHSMGGAIAVRYLQMYPGRIAKAVLTAPMLDIKLGMPSIQAEAISCYMVKTGRGEEYIAGQAPFPRGNSFETSSCSSRERYEYYFNKKRSCQEFQNNAGSYSWLYESLKAVKKIEKEKRKIQIPLCIFTAEQDHLVSRSGQIDLAEKTPYSRLILVKDTKHEIYMAPTRIQKQYWRYIFSFLQENREVKEW